MYFSYNLYEKKTKQKQKKEKKTFDYYSLLILCDKQEWYIPDSDG